MCKFSDEYYYYFDIRRRLPYNLTEFETEVFLLLFSTALAHCKKVAGATPKGAPDGLLYLLKVTTYSIAIASDIARCTYGIARWGVVSALTCGGGL